MNTTTDFPSLPGLAAPHRFRVGVPSYVYPAPILPNVRTLAPVVDDIELVLFESPRAGHNLPSPVAISRLRRLAAARDLTYTVHLPLDRHPGGVRRAERLAHRRQVVKIMRLTAPLQPWAWILHLDGIGPDAAPGEVRSWQARVLETLPAIVDQAPHPSRLCVENLAAPFGWCEVFLERFGLGVCLDVGHLALAGRDIGGHFRRYPERLRVIHLHGARSGRDHLPLDVMTGHWVRRFLDLAAGFSGVLTLELFSFEDVRRSLLCLDRALSCRSG